MPRLLTSTVSLLLASALLLPGCQPGRKAAKPQSGRGADDDKTTQTAQGVTIEDEDGKARIRFVGVKGRRGAGDVFLLRSWLIRASHVVSHQVYVTDRYLAPAARGWNAATGPEGERLRVTKIETKTENCGPEGCPRTEAYGAAIDDVSLRAAKDRGYTIKFSAESGARETITLTAEQIRAQIEAIDQKLAALPPPKAAGAAKRRRTGPDGADETARSKRKRSSGY